MNILNKHFTGFSPVSQTYEKRNRMHPYLSLFLAGVFFLLFGSTALLGQSPQTFTSSGTFTVPAGVTGVTVELWGGGGAGGGATNALRTTGGGGGGGTYTKATNVSVTPGQVINVTVGAGGIAVTGANGGAGGTSIFGSSSPVSAIGGNGGLLNTGTTAGTLNGAGAAAAIGITYNGGAGGTGNAVTTGTAQLYSGGGGGGAGAGGNGNAPTPIGIEAGVGGIAGAGTAGGNGAAGVNTLGGGNGAAATQLAGGGSGGRNATTLIQAQRAGGNGFRGQVIVTWEAPILTITGGTTAHGGSCVASAASSITYTITNTSAISATNGLVLTSNDPQFVISNLSSTTIAPLSSVTFDVTFTPTSSGSKSAIVTVSSLNTTLGNTPTISLTGTGTAPPNAPTVGTITQPTCAVTTGSVQLTGLPSGSWTIVASNGGGTISGSGSTTTFTGLTAGVSYTFKVTDNTTGCTSVPSNAATIDADPTATITLTSATGTDAQSVCLADAITDITYNITGATGATLTGQPQNINGVYNNGVFTISGTTFNMAAPGLYTYTISTLGGCGTVTKTGTINVVNNPNIITLTSAPATTAQSICFGSPVTNITYSTTNASGATFSGLPAGVTGSWASNAVTISGTPTVTGTFNYTVTLTGGCSNPVVTATGTITVGPKTTISYASTPYCTAGGTASVTFSGESGGTYSAPMGLSINSGTGDIDLAASSAGVYTVTYTYLSSCGSTLTATTTVTVNTTPSVSLSPLSITGCIGSPVTINSLVSPATQPNYIHVWSVSGNVSNVTTGGTSALTTSSATFTGNAQGSVVVNYKVTDGNGCMSQTVSTNVTIDAPPVPTSAGTNQTQCENGVFQLAASMAGQPSGALGTWSGSGVMFSNVNDPNATASGLVAGTSTTLTWTVSNGSCSSTSATVTLTNQFIRLSSPLMASACSGSPFVYIPTSATAGASFSWTRPAVAGISNAAVTNGVGNVSETLINTTNTPIDVVYLFTTSANGCSNAIPEFVVVTVNPKPAVTNMTATICSNAGFALTPTDGVNGSVPMGTTYAWSAPSVTGGMTGGVAGSGSSTITGILSNATSALQTATYTVTPTANGCAGSSFTVTVSVKPLPAITAMTTSTCSNTSFTVTPTNGTNGFVPTGTTYTWTTPSVTGGMTGGVSGSGSNIGGSLTNSTTSNQTATYTVTPTADGCAGATFTVTVTVKPTPSLSSSLSIAAICSGSLATYTPTSALSGATFSWSRAAVSGITQPTTTGTGGINETLTNTTANPITVTYVYVTTANGCSNASTPQSVTVVVNPKPTLSSALTGAICSGTSFNYTAMSATVGTTFAWTRAAVIGITEGASSGSGNILETLTNTTTAPINVTYVYALSANGCTNTQNVVVTVNPTPKLSSALAIAAICSGATASYTATSATSGATFAWSRATVSGITEVGTSGTGNVSETLTNTTTAPITVTYAYTITANGCSNPQSVTVVVNPKPKLSSALSIAAICSGTTVNYTPTSATSGATFAWTRAVVSGISNAAGSGSGNISEILTNTTNAPITVTYSITTTANSCSGTAENVTVVVNPKLTLSSTLTPTAICSGSTFAYSATSPVSGAVFSWTRAAVAGISQAAITTPVVSASISEMLTNTTNASISVTYTFVITANGCSNSESVTVVVKPTPSVNNATVATCSGGTFAVLPQNGVNGNIPTGTTYSWAAPSVTGGMTGGAGGSNAPIVNGTLTNTTSTAQTATYTVTPSANGCAGTPFTVTVTVSPKANITNMTAAICSGGTFTATPTDGINGTVPMGTTYSWAAPSVTGGMTGGASGSGASAISGTLVNNTTAAQTATYNVTATTGSCTSTPFTVIVTVNPTPQITGTTATVCHGSTFKFTPQDGVDGRVPTGTTYSWPGNTGANTSVEFVVSNLTSSPITSTYQITPTVGGCVGSAFNIVLTIYPTPSISGPTAVCVGSKITLTSGSTPASSGAWVSSAPSIATVNATGEVTGVAAGTTNITFTDVAGCTNTVTITVNPRPKATLTTANGATFISQGACSLQLNAAITGGQSPYSPNTWSSTSSLLQFSSLTGMSTSVSSSTSSPITIPASVTINFETIDANGCLSEVSPISLTIYPELQATITGGSGVCISATLALSASITGGNATGRTVTWISSNTAIATVNSMGVVTGIAAGTADITLTVTDANGCSVSKTQTVTVNASSVSTSTINNISCNGANDGIICLSTTGASPFTYSWSNGVSGSSNCNAGLVAGTYAVTTTDNNGCTSTLTGLTITEPAAISATISGSTAVCQGGTAPSVTFTGAGGTAPYTFTYQINNGSNQTVTTTSGNSVTVAQSTASAGTFIYTLVSVTSGVCTKTQTGSATINIGAPITGIVSAGPDQPAVGASTTLAATAAPSGTTGAWSVVPANASITFSNVNAANATVSNLPFGATTLRWTVSNTGGCSTSDDVVLTRISITLDIVAALEGPLDNATGRMNANIRLLSNFPTDGLGNPSLAVRSVTGLYAIVDWITVELRTVGNVPATGNYVRQGLIRTDGHIVEAADGISPLKFDVPDGNYFIVVNHRNHIGFRSNTQENLTASASPINLNFAVGNVLAYGTGSLKFINGVYCAFAGDCSTDENITATDYNQWKPKRFVDGYEPADFNLDGTVDSRDYSLWNPNRFQSAQY